MVVLSLPQDSGFSSHFLNFEASYRMNGRTHRQLQHTSPPSICRCVTRATA
jgi:hypothetical protein